MFFDIVWNRKPSQDDLTVLLGKSQKEASDRLDELNEIKAILKPFDGMRQSESAREYVQTARDMLIVDRAIIQQLQREVEQFQDEIFNLTERNIALEAQIVALQEYIQEDTAIRKEVYIKAVEQIRELKEQIDTVKRQKNEDYDRFTAQIVALQEQQIMLSTTTPKKPAPRNRKKATTA